jgi:hypothetical protein
MKTSLIILLAAGCISLVSCGADDKFVPDTVVVKVLDTPLPPEEGKKEKFLWNNFANKPNDEKFESYGTKKWRRNFRLFTSVLVKKAKDQKLDSASLRKALDLVLKTSEDKTAYLPVGAYQTTLHGKPVWIITVKWEYPSMGDKGESVGLGHVCVFVFDQETLKQVGFVTCC